MFVAIVGGSGSGKSWLADQLQKTLGPRATLVSQDNFYRDRSHLSAHRRQRLNFDHPMAIDWEALEGAMQDLRTRGWTLAPRYDFATHCRKAAKTRLASKPVILVEGLWLLRRLSLRKLFDLSIFLDCPAPTRLERRLARDQHARGRTAASVREQFASTVEPMHQRFVTPQRNRADIVFYRPCDSADLEALANRILNLLK